MHRTFGYFAIPFVCITSSCTSPFCIFFICVLGIFFICVFSLVWYFLSLFSIRSPSPLFPIFFFFSLFLFFTELFFSPLISLIFLFRLFGFPVVKGFAIGDSW